MSAKNMLASIQKNRVAVLHTIPDQFPPLLRQTRALQSPRTDFLHDSEHVRPSFPSPDASRGPLTLLRLAVQFSLKFYTSSR